MSTENWGKHEKRQNTPFQQEQAQDFMIHCEENKDMKKHRWHGAYTQLEDLYHLTR